MLGNYTIMDLVTLGGVLTAVGTVLGGASAILTILRDNKSIKKELGVLSQNQKELSQNQNELSNRLFVVSGNVDKLSSSVLSKTESLSELFYGSHPVLRLCTDDVNSYRVKAEETGDSMEEISKFLHSIHEEYYEVVNDQPYEYHGIRFSPGEVYSKSKILELLNNN
ncbi:MULTISPECIES: hypothetical protein [Streptococcus]|uniref:Uncharacterized protein n=1 Tax=Streptococcus caledonicus TaxID=2614158 RepID=A0ABW0UGN5_9STRE|nr:hypothetical protein [Streptococcus sp. S784/96/1]